MSTNGFLGATDALPIAMVPVAMQLPTLGATTLPRLSAWLATRGIYAEGLLAFLSARGLVAPRQLISMSEADIEELRSKGSVPVHELRAFERMVAKMRGVPYEEPALAPLAVVPQPAPGAAPEAEGDEDSTRRGTKRGRDGKTSSSEFDARTDEVSAHTYFQYYGQLLFQQNMLQDVVRTGTYRRAVMENAVDFAGKVVVDVGTGSGVLALFAAQAGARKVYALDASNATHDAKRLVLGNGFEHVIEVIKGKVEDLELPEKADILISEPMGTMLLNERMIETYLCARKRFLRPGGKMFPTTGTVYAAPFTDEALYAELYAKSLFFAQTSFQGIDLTSLRERAQQCCFRQPVIQAFDPSLLVSTPVSLPIDFLTTEESQLHRVLIPFEFTSRLSANIHGVATWFDVCFLGSQSTVTLSTAPGQPTTHWHQVRLMFPSPVFVVAGQAIKGVMELVAHAAQSYVIHLTLHEPVVLHNTMDLKEPYQRVIYTTTNIPAATAAPLA